MMGENLQIYTYPTWEVADWVVGGCAKREESGYLTLIVSIAIIRLLMGFLLALEDYFLDLYT